MIRALVASVAKAMHLGVLSNHSGVLESDLIVLCFQLLIRFVLDEHLGSSELANRFLNGAQGLLELLTLVSSLVLEFVVAIHFVPVFDRTVGAILKGRVKSDLAVVAEF